MQLLDLGITSKLCVQKLARKAHLSQGGFFELLFKHLLDLYTVKQHSHPEALCIASGAINHTSHGVLPRKGTINCNSSCNPVVELCNTRLGVEVTRQGISTAHRLRSKTNKGAWPVVVRFMMRCVDRVAHFDHRLDLLHTTVFFHPHQLLHSKQIMGAWTYNGEVYIKKAESSN